MQRRIASLLLGLIIVLPFVAPASAAQPAASPAVASPAPSQGAAPTQEPTPTAEPSPSQAPVPSQEPDFSAAPTSVPSTPPANDLTIDPSGRYIVILRTGTDTAAVVEKARKHDGVKADKTYARAIRGFAAKLDKKQKLDLLADPNVVAVVPDEVTHLTQTTPTGVSRVGDLRNPIAKIDGVDQRVDADVAIVDTGITLHPDLNVAGGYNCSTSDRTAWRDEENHGTHVAGIVGALDNSFGVVGVAPGARVWGVKILNDSGDGLISWYICGLDWILAQRDPTDATRPLFEAVNMSVTKYGSDDHNCGLTNNDPLHQAICRVVAGGITVVAAAANDHHNASLNIPASYDEVITVSALADTDGLPGGLGGDRCFSWGGYDKDDTFADFSNYGGDVDLIAPGKCILSTIPGPSYAYMSGTSMAAPTVTGAVALYKSTRPNATPAEVRASLRFLGNQDWAYWTDPDPVHEPLLDVSRIGTLGTFDLSAGSAPIATVERGTTGSVPVTIVRSDAFFEPVALSAATLPDGWSSSASTSAMGWGTTVGTISVVVPKDTTPGTYDIGVQGTNQGRTVTATVSVDVVQNDPTAQPPVTSFIPGVSMGTSSLEVRVTWPAATDPTSAIAGYEVQTSKNGGSWGSTFARTPAQLDARYTLVADASYRFRVRAVDAAGNWSPWSQAVNSTRIHPVDDRTSAVVRGGYWLRASSSGAWRTTLTGSTSPGVTVRMMFTGRAVAVVVPRHPSRGKARVYVDGVYVTTIDLSARTSMSRRLQFARSFATAGTHSIMLKTVGAGRTQLVQLDAFVVIR